MNPLLLLLVVSAVNGALPLCPDPSHATADYIVVGAGAGGGPVAARLAEAGFSVLVIDAGHSTVNFNTTIPSFFIFSYTDPQIELNYSISNYPPGFEFQKNDVWYPRARALGGCTIHNSLVNDISGTESTFNEIAKTFNDSSWTRANMQHYFKLLERNLYLDQPNNDHGFEGWLGTTVAANQTLNAGTPPAADPQATAFTAGVDGAFPAVPDFNALSATNAVGASIMSSTINANNTRSSIHERLLHVATKHSLAFAVDSLATKILMCKTAQGKTRAYGVEVAPGAALPVAANFSGKKQLVTREVTAKREVIVSGGAFQTPQLLMLSGIGDPRELSKHGIRSVVNLPGVGKNLQDNDELPIIFELVPKNVTGGLNCGFSQDPATNPCLAEWINTGHRTSMSAGGAFGITAKTSPELAEPDVLIYGGSYYGIGYIRNFFPPPINAWTFTSLLGPAQSRGTVSLTGSHPQDPLSIQKLRFQSVEAKRDLAKHRKAIQLIRDLVSRPNLAQYIVKEVLPGPDVVTDEQLDAHVYNYTFGHHSCCTSAIGPSNDPMAVLDNEFRVRGVEALRVVDSSSFPRPIGFFPTTPTYMMSEKAAAVIIAGTK